MGSSTLGDVQINLKANDVSMTSGLNKINETLENSLGQLRSFRAVTELAFGFHAGRFFLEKLHEGVAHLGETFLESSRAGETFSESIGDAFSKLLGMHTLLDDHNERMKVFHQVVDDAAKAQEHFNAALAKATGTEPKPQFPALENGKELESALDEKRKAFAKASKESGEQQQKLADFKRDHAELIALGAVSPEAGPSHLKSEYDALVAGAKRLQDEADALGAALRQETKDAQQANAEAESAAAQDAFAEGELAAATEAAAVKMNRANEALGTFVDAIVNKPAALLTGLADLQGKQEQKSKENDELAAVRRDFAEQEKKLREKLKGPQFVGLEEFAKQVQGAAGQSGVDKQIEALHEQERKMEEQIRNQHEQTDYLKRAAKALESGIVGVFG